MAALGRCVPARLVPALLAILLLGFGAGGAAAKVTPAQWVEQFWPEAKRAGISRAVYDRALGGFTPDPEVLERASHQAEFVKPLWDYLASAVSETRVANGRALLRTHAGDLARMEGLYGVDRHVIVAIWGMESAYGAILDNEGIKNTIRSLATLAYAGGRRARYGRQQLVAALKIVQRGDVAVADMVGSWAGATGHTQFIPTTYQAYAVDYDGDGRRDIWTTPMDALASAANYLRAAGWRSGHAWGYEVVLPKGFDYRLAEGGTERSLAEWQALGIRRVRGAEFPRPEDDAVLMVPAGARGPAFLLLRNFYVTKRYNNADAYALAVGHLADRLRGFGPFEASWPTGETPLGREEREELQRLLARRGLYHGGIDGKIGRGSRAALRAYQTSIGMEADGYPSQPLLQRLRQGG